MADESIRLHRFDRAPQAHLVRTILASEGISAEVVEGEPVGPYGEVPAELYVCSGDATRAFEILAEVEAPPDSGELAKGARLQITLLLGMLLMYALGLLVVPGALRIIGTALAIAFAVAGWIGVSGMRLRRHLLGVGHDWVGFLDACAIYARVRGAGWSIPRATDVETMPGMRRDVDSLVAVARSVRRTRAGRRRKVAAP